MDSFQKLYSLTPEQVRAGMPVRLQATVLCCDADWGQCFVHDGTQTVYFAPGKFRPLPQQGDTGELTGTTCWVEGGATVTNLKLAVREKRRLPPAKALPIPQLAADYGQWIETTGRVRVAEINSGRLALVVHDRDQSCLCYVLGLPRTNDFTWLLDAQVRLQGINVSKTVNGRLESASLMVPSIGEVSVVAAPSVNPRQLPVLSIESLLSSELGAWTNNLVHLQGVVAACQPKEFLEVKDPTGVLRARILQETPVKPGERVDVWGCLEVSPTQAMLRDACFEVVHGAEIAVAPPAPIPATTKPAAVLTRVTDIQHLRRDQAAQHLPVRLRGVITCADPEWQVGFFQDSTDGIYFDLTQPEVRAGQWVELTGQTMPGNFAHQLTKVTVTILGTTNLPTPVAVDLEDLANDLLDAHWIRMEGVVRRMSPSWNHLTLDLTTAKGRFSAILPWPNEQPLPTHLIDAQVSVQGACSSTLNTRGQLTGVTLRVPSLEPHISILQAPPADPFAVPTLAITNVATFDPERLAGRRVKIAGVVTLVLPDESCFVQDSSGGLRVHSPGGKDLEAGDAVEVLGFPTLGEFSPGLEEVVLRKTGHALIPKPVPTSAEQLLQEGVYDATLVELPAQLLQPVVNSARPKLLLQSGSVIFAAYLRLPGSAKSLTALRAGSELRVRGVCVVQGADNHQPAAFRLLLTQPKDVNLVWSAPWWTTRQIVLLVAGLALVVLAALGWIGLLRRQVRTQTGLIRQQLQDRELVAQILAQEKHFLATLIEHLPIACITWDAERRITSWNPAATRIFGFSAAEALGRTAPEFLVAPTLQPLVQQVGDTLLMGQGILHSVNENLTKDGRTVFCDWTNTSIPGPDGRVLSLLSMVQDVTDRKQAEEALRLSEERFRSVWEHSIDGMRLTDGEGRILAVNEAYCQLVRRPREELVGQPFSVVYKGHGPDDGIEVYHQRFQTGEIVPRLTARVQLWNGDELDLEISNSFVQVGPQNKMLFGLFRDISARKRTEERLAAFSHLGQRLSAAKTAKEAGLIIVEVADRLLGWDACFCDLYSAGEDRLHNILNMDLIDGRRTEGPLVGDNQPPPPLSRRVLTEGALLLSQDPTQPRPHPYQPFGDAARRSASLLFVPIRNGSVVIGVLSIQSYTPQAYNQQSLETLQALADHCGAALDRIRAEEALRQAQERLDFLISQSPAVIYSLKTDGQTVAPVWVSNNLKRLLGYEPEAVFHPDWWPAVLHPADRRIIELSGPRRLAEGQLAIEYRVRHKNGDYRWLRDEQRLVRNAAGQAEEIVGTWTDITERKQAEAALAYERDLLTTLLDNLPDLIYFKDLQSRYVRVSKSKLEMAFGLALSRYRASSDFSDTEFLPWHLSSLDRFAEYVVGRTDLDFYDEERARASLEDEQAILRTGQPLLGKLEEVTCPEGKTCWRLTTKMPWRDKDGQLIGTFGISKDITFIKEAEAKLEAAHKQLVETSRQAGMAEVATSVLHNVGNVLNSVNVSASLLAEKVKHSKAANLAKVVTLLNDHAAQLGEFLTRDPKGQQLPLYLGQLAERLAREQAFLLNELGLLTGNIDHIKHIVAMQQGFAKVAGVSETLAATDLVEDALRLNANFLARHAIQVQRDYDPHVPLITVEKHKVLQILVNLIRNAQHACQETPHPDKRLTLRVANGADRVCISVSDNGVGIAPENLTRIFNFGFTTRKDGHGFGLHSGALAARELGGSLRAESAGLGQGATFILDLPGTPQNAAAAHPPAPLPPHSHQNPLG